MFDPNKAHYLVVTGIILKDGKYLITKRSPAEKAFPNLWTVPGGKLELNDYTKRPKDTGFRHQAPGFRLQASGHCRPSSRRDLPGLFVQ